MWIPWEKVLIDLYGSIPTGESILGIIDSSSRWPEIQIIKSTSTMITNMLNKAFKTDGFPHEIVRDNTPNLISAEISEFCKQYQSFPYENHCKCYRKLTSRSWPVLFAITYFFLCILLFRFKIKSSCTGVHKLHVRLQLWT